MAIDRASGCPVIIASAQGGVEIEAVAKENRDAIIREPINSTVRLAPFQARKVAYRLGLQGDQVRKAAKIMHQLTDMFIEKDASLAEINPLVVTKPTDEKPRRAGAGDRCQNQFR